jgi:meiotic recombination protein SPO11
MMDDSEEEEIIDAIWTKVPNEQISFSINRIIPPDEVKRRIKQLATQVATNIIQTPQTSDVVIQFNRRGSALNSQIDPLLGTRVLYDTPLKSVISLSKTPREFAIFLRVLSIIMNALNTNQFLSKRSIFYQDVTLFCDQTHVNKAIEDIACCLEVPRASLGVIACPKGFVAGPIQWVDDTDVVTDCSAKIHTIPSLVDAIKIGKTTAIAVIVVEKETIFMRLVQSTIVHEVILVTGRGVPDYSTRLFLKLIDDAFLIPILGLFDLDPYGFAIFCIYKYGSRSASYDALNMTCTRMRWLGLRPSEIGLIQKKCLLELTQRDRNIIDRFLQEDRIPIEYRAELEIMRQKNVKAELDALMTDANELTHLYLPHKFARQDWI